MYLEEGIVKTTLGVEFGVMTLNSVAVEQDYEVVFDNPAIGLWLGHQAAKRGLRDRFTLRYAAVVMR